jgi:hypothetical protein
MFNMKMIVQFGVDACLPSLDSSTTAMSIDDSAQADALSDMNNQQPSVSTTTSPANNIVHAGTQVLQDTLVEMILRSPLGVLSRPSGLERTIPAAGACSDAVAAPGRAPAWRVYQASRME